MWAYVGGRALYLNIWYRFVQADILPCEKKKMKHQLSQFSELSLLVATSNKQYFEENTMCEWFEVILWQKRYRCIASKLRARQNGKNSVLYVKRRDFRSFSTYSRLSWLRMTPKLVGS